MRKLWAFLLLGVFSLCSTAAEAKVCFLPNVLIGGKCVSFSKVKRNDCKGFTETRPCDEVGKETIETCSVGGTTYYKCGCRGDVISWEVINEHPGWICETGYAQECGCSAEHISCRYEYRYLGDGTGKCAKSDENDNSKGVGACVLPNGRVYYKDCNCNGYPYECDGITGLKAPTGVDDTVVGCKSPHDNNYKYKECECADGWTSGTCEHNTNGCLMPVSYVTTNDGELTCSMCDERLCKASGESNLEAIYCSPKSENGRYSLGEYLSKTVTDCVDLGFVQGATGGFCPAGTQKSGEVGVKCPFDGRYMFCEEGEGCYPTEEACEVSEGVRSCVTVGGCYRISECSAGYELDGNRAACVVSKCPEGFTTGELHCGDSQLGIAHGYTDDVLESLSASGNKACKKCACNVEAAREEGYCMYSKDPSDETAWYAGDGILSEPCCDGSYSKCEFLVGSTKPSAGTATSERHEACGETYYVSTSCLDGYVLNAGRCESVTCGTGYSSDIQSAKDCNNSGLYEGGLGWTITAQKDSSGHIVKHDGKTCFKCECNTNNLSCTWNASNKGKFGRLVEESACCDGGYKSCVANLCKDSGINDFTDDSDASNDCIPQGATISLCTSIPEYAVSIKKYDACGQETRCLVDRCEQGYRPSDDGKKCVAFSSCSDIGYTTNAYTDEEGWSCSATRLTDKNGHQCYKCGCADGYAMEQPGICLKNCDNGLMRLCPTGYTCRLVDGCFEKTGCEERFYSEGSKCLRDFCGKHQLSDSCYEGQVVEREVRVNGLTCKICRDANLTTCDGKEGFYNYLTCNIVTRSDCEFDGLCYKPTEECASVNDNSESSTPCGGSDELFYSQKCGLYWTGECYQKMETTDIQEHVYVQPVIEKISTLWRESENTYITIDDVMIDVTIYGEEASEGSAEDIGGGIVDLYGTVFEADTSLHRYYYVKVNGISASVSEHRYGSVGNFSDNNTIREHYDMKVAGGETDITIIDNRYLVYGDELIRKGTLDMNLDREELWNLLRGDILTGGKCELTRHFNPGNLEGCRVWPDSRDNPGQGDYSGMVSYFESPCGQCFLDGRSYKECDEEFGQTMCVSEEDPRWVHIIPSNFNESQAQGSLEFLEENKAYIIVTSELDDAVTHNDAFYDEYSGYIDWQ